MDYETKKQTVFELRSLGKSLDEISKEVSLVIPQSNIF